MLQHYGHIQRIDRGQMATTNFEMTANSKKKNVTLGLETDIEQVIMDKCIRNEDTKERRMRT